MGGGESYDCDLDMWKGEGQVVSGPNLWPVHIWTILGPIYPPEGVIYFQRLPLAVHLLKLGTWYFYITWNT